MQKTNPMGKTLVFCVDQEHAQEMRKELQSLLSTHDPERAKKYPNYVCRVTADEGSIRLGHLSRFQELETEEPVILTSSQLLTTGVDAKMVKNVVLARVVGSMSEFKQIIGRGTRIEPEYGKLWFSIIDYTGSATRHFADPEFDGFPEFVTEQTIDDGGTVVEEQVIDEQPTQRMMAPDPKVRKLTKARKSMSHPSPDSLASSMSIVTQRSRFPMK